MTAGATLPTTGKKPCVILVDLNVQRGLCCLCNQPARMDDTTHCGNRVNASAINEACAALPSLAAATRVSTMRPRGTQFLGVGRIVPDSTGHHFVPTLAMGDLR